jgi:hypothetical protein
MPLLTDRITPHQTTQQRLSPQAQPQAQYPIRQSQRLIPLRIPRQTLPSIHPTMGHTLQSHLSISLRSILQVIT